MTISSKLTAKPLRSALAGALLLAVPAVPLVMAAPASAQGDQLDQAVAALRAITTMQADFVQTDRNGQSVRGVMTLKQGGKIRFEYEKAAKMLIVSNGRTLTVADYEVNDFKRYPIGNSPLGALLNPSKDVKRYGRLVPTANPNVISIAVKDPGKPEYGEMTLIMIKKAGAPGGLELNSWVARDAQNKLTTVRLSNQRYGVPAPDSLFTYVDTSRKLGPQH